MVWKENPLTKLPPQTNISPLVRAARWTALIAGIAYGSRRLSRLSKKEAPIQEEWDKIKAARKARLEAEFKEFEHEQMLDLKQQVDAPPTPKE